MLLDSFPSLHWTSSSSSSNQPSASHLSFTMPHVYPSPCLALPSSRTPSSYHIHLAPSYRCVFYTLHIIWYEITPLSVIPLFSPNTAGLWAYTKHPPSPHPYLSTFVMPTYRPIPYYFRIMNTQISFHLGSPEFVLWNRLLPFSLFIILFVHIVFIILLIAFFLKPIL